MNERIRDAAAAIVESRNFCGNEREALRDWEDDFGKLTPDERIAVFSVAEEIWGGYQRAADVTRPISAHERARINRILA